jgi:hypothetical protein
MAAEPTRHEWEVIERMRMMTEAKDSDYVTLCLKSDIRELIAIIDRCFPTEFEPLNFEAPKPPEPSIKG